MSRLLDRSPRQLAEALLGEGRRRAWLVLDPHTGTYRASHAILQPVAEFLDAEKRDCRRHEAIFLEAHADSGTLLTAFVHSTVRGQAQGGLRRWRYARLEDLLRDGLRLALGMTRKNAMAGLWWGGGKGVIAAAPGAPEPEPELRGDLYRAYGAFVSSLRGCYVTAEDVGTSPLDMAEVFRTTRFATCIPPDRGGAGNPSLMTASGVVCAMEAALDFAGRGDLAGKTVVLQGTGNVGGAMIPLLLERGVERIVASEISSERRGALLDAFAGDPVEVRAAQPGDCEILAEPCDVLAPCALGGVLGPKTIPGIRASLVCGPANNQLLDEHRDARALAERGITYVPDYVANRMGIVFCANEQYGSPGDDPAVERHLDREWEHGVHQTVRRVLESARGGDFTPLDAANQLADELAQQPHPIWGHRARRIVESLAASDWARR